jgi:hypothetical protein
MRLMSGVVGDRGLGTATRAAVLGAVLDPLIRMLGPERFKVFVLLV